MAFEQRANSAQLFKNRDKKSDSHPNLKGEGALDATAIRQYLADNPETSTIPLELAAWTKESEKAGKWLSLSVKLKGERVIRQHFDDRSQQQSGTRGAATGADIANAFPAEDDRDIEF
jgi:hypothetical protein